MTTSSAINGTYHLPGDIDISFTDSGAPPDSKDYTTLIIFPGSAFTRDSFEKLPQVAHSFNLRTVVASRRGYPGSTSYTEDELEDLNQGRKAHLDKLGSLVGSFVEKFIDENENSESGPIPKIGEEGRTGGIAITGWSSGAITAMSMFADPALVSGRAYSLLQKYVKDLVIYDAPAIAFGYPYLNDMYYPWLDKDVNSPEEMSKNLVSWASSYYSHPNPHGPSTSLLDSRKLTDHQSKWTPEEQDKFFHKPSVSQELSVFGPMQPAINTMAKEVLFNPDLASSYFPSLKLTYLVCTRSNWLSAWGAIETRRIYVEEYMKLPSSERLRELEFVPIEGANHMVHWDDPEGFLDAVLESIQGDRSGSASR
ncbi:hypothetical protein D9758_015783 [Tetrapyrgos nigripes]|uniref:AB hydrolase-1 domain-containing protein n=1 Tax=Tetrapyrgos nigripes TaxID=182062 RepID=A0A8H5C5X2_9AGAR|nr:hypothetical protein D9758_015783 [Tetrapyrgos nigripes]